MHPLVPLHHRGRQGGQAELDQRAEQGWELEEEGLFTATFRRAEHPAPCWVEPARWKSVRRKDEDARADYLALCDEAGWELISEDGGLFYFRAREGTDPAPIQTDAGVEWEDGGRRPWLTRRGNLLYIAVLGQFVRSGGISEISPGCGSCFCLTWLWRPNSSCSCGWGSTCSWACGWSSTGSGAAGRRRGSPSPCPGGGPPGSGGPIPWSAGH